MKNKTLPPSSYIPKEELIEKITEILKKSSERAATLTLEFVQHLTCRR